MTVTPDHYRQPGRAWRGAGWALLLLGSIAAAAMVPWFAVFIPVVFGAWLLARFGFVPAFLRPRHPALRMTAGADADVTSMEFTFESENGHGPDADAVLGALRRAGDAHAGASRGGDGLAAAWPDDRLALTAAREVRDGGCVVRGQLRGERELVERVACDVARELRQAGAEVVTTGWLRHAERLAAG